MIAVLRAILLDGVICQVDEIIVKVLGIHGVGLTRSAKIPLPKEVNVHVLSQCHPDTNVKLTLVDKQRFLYVLLDDEGLRSD